MEDILVPLFVFGSTVAVIWLVSYFNYKKRKTAHDTVRHAVENGQQISAELVENMSLIFDPVRADLRRGVLFIAVGLAIMVLGTIIAFEDDAALGPVLGVGAFPIILGVAYLGLWRFGHGSRS